MEAFNSQSMQYKGTETDEWVRAEFLLSGSDPF
jgi:hypothetical protein